jgi:hypothetical protein
MKTIKALALSALCFFIFQSKISAQETSEPKTLFGNGKFKSIGKEDLGFFVAPAYGITRMDGSTASLFNVRGGISFKDKVTIGSYFTTSINEINPVSETLPDVYMDYWSVGGFAEYTLLSKKVVHVTFPLFIGYGEVQMDNESGEAGLSEANFFQIEPSAMLQVNLHKYVRFNVGAGYRFIGQMNYRNFNQSDISGVTGFIGLKFGMF